MRDWNLDVEASCITFTGKFVEYLWGIETIATNDSYKKQRQFVEYLWGIETTFHTLAE